MNRRAKSQLTVSPAATTIPRTAAVPAMTKRHGSCGSPSPNAPGNVWGDAGTDAIARLKTIGSQGAGRRANRTASVPDTHTEVADPTKTTQKRMALALRVVKKTSR